VQGTPPAKAVTDAADDHDASLIVLGAHRKTGLGGRVAGSVAAEVASRSQRPVMIVHDGAGDEAALSVRPSGRPGRRLEVVGPLVVRPRSDSRPVGVEEPERYQPGALPPRSFRDADLAL
jgi:hypothetical protein